MLECLTTLFGMGRGVPTLLEAPTFKTQKILIPLKLFANVLGEGGHHQGGRSGKRSFAGYDCTARSNSARFSRSTIVEIE